MISGAALASHFVNGYASAISGGRYRCFSLSGGTLEGIGKPGEIVWSCVRTNDARLKTDVGFGERRQAT